MRFLRLARLGGKTYGGCLPDASQFPPSPGGVEDGLDPGAERKKPRAFFETWKTDPEKSVPRVRNGVPKTLKFDTKLIKYGP